MEAVFVAIMLAVVVAVAAMALWVAHRLP